MENANSENNRIEVDRRYLQFSLGTELYAMPLLHVREVIAMPETTPIPFSPKHFVGIMNLRGQVISVLDLRTKMGITPSEGNKDEAVIIVDLNPIYVGIVIDSVNRVLQVDPELLSVAPHVESKKQSDYILGVYRGDDQISVLVEIGKLLDLEDLKHIRNKAA